MKAERIESNLQKEMKSIKDHWVVSLRNKNDFSCLASGTNFTKVLPRSMNRRNWSRPAVTDKCWLWMKVGKEAEWMLWVWGESFEWVRDLYSGSEFPWVEMSGVCLTAQIYDSSHKMFFIWSKYFSHKSSISFQSLGDRCRVTLLHQIEELESAFCLSK